MNQYKVMVSNLPKEVNEDRLSSIFCDLDFVRITVAKSSKGHCKGFCHIEFANEKDHKKALEMDGTILGGKKLKIENEEEDHMHLKEKKTQDERPKRDISFIEKELDEKVKKDEEMFKEDPNKGLIHQQMQELSESMNRDIFCKEEDKCCLEIKVSLSADNPQLLSELREHLFSHIGERQFKEQIDRNDELKKIYGNCCNNLFSLEQKLCKIKHTKFDQNPMKDEQIKILCSVLTKAYENSDIDFNICNKLESNIKSINTIPEKSILFILCFSHEVIGEHCFKELITDKRKQKVIEMNLMKKLSEILEIPFGEIVFLKYSDCSPKGSVKFKGMFPSKVLARYTGVNMDVEEYIYKNIKKEIIEGLGNIYPLKSVDLSLQQVKTRLCLNPLDFDSKGDVYFSSEEGGKQARGGLVYYQPCSKWRRYGLRVLGLYENDDWLKMDGNPKEWAVAFHGIKNSGEKGFKSLLQSRFIGAGTSIPMHLNKGHLSPINRYKPIPKTGIYFSQNVEDCYTEPIELDGHKYFVAFQCRVHPHHVWETGNRTFIVVDNPIYARPYGIVLKKLD